MIFSKGRVQKVLLYDYEDQNESKDSDFYQGQDANILLYEYEDQDDNKDSYFHKGQDASSNGEQRRKIIFARHFSSIGNFFHICLGDDYFWPTTHSSIQSKRKLNYDYYFFLVFSWFSRQGVWERLPQSHHRGGEKDCPGQSNINLKDFLKNLQKVNFQEQMTGCQRPCNYLEYSFIGKKQQPA